MCYLIPVIFSQSHLQKFEKRWSEIKFLNGEEEIIAKDSFIGLNLLPKNNFDSHFPAYSPP